MIGRTPVNQTTVPPAAAAAAAAGHRALTAYVTLTFTAPVDSLLGHPPRPARHRRYDGRPTVSVCIH